MTTAWADDPMTIRVYYSCALCGLTRASCEVPARMTEDVVTWLRQATRLISLAHDQRSVDCHPETLTDILIPVTGANRLGGPAVS